MSRMNISRRGMSAVFLGFMFALSDPFSDGKASADAMWGIGWTGSTWGDWVHLGGVIASRPSCVSWGEGHIRVSCFARGSDNQLWGIGWTGSTWGAWAPLGGVIKEEPSCVSWGQGHIRVSCFARWADPPVTG